MPTGSFIFRPNGTWPPRPRNASCGPISPKAPTSPIPARWPACSARSAWIRTRSGRCSRAPSTPTRSRPTRRRRTRWARTACRSTSSIASTASPAPSPPRCSCAPCGRRTPTSLVPVRITSLGFRTDVALRVLEGAEVTGRGDCLVVRTPGHPDFWWGNFLLLARVPRPGEAAAWLARFAAEFPAARHVAFGVDTAEDAPLPEDLAAAGLAAERAAVLTATLQNPPPRPNTEAEIRPLDSDADWRQSVELAIRCFDGEEPEFLERRAMTRRRVTQ